MLMKSAEPLQSLSCPSQTSVLPLKLFGSASSQSEQAS
jgi:hypothetical protein